MSSNMDVRYVSILPLTKNASLHNYKPRSYTYQFYGYVGGRKRNDELYPARRFSTTDIFKARLSTKQRQGVYTTHYWAFTPTLGRMHWRRRERLKLTGVT